MDRLRERRVESDRDVTVCLYGSWSTLFLSTNNLSATLVHGKAFTYDLGNAIYLYRLQGSVVLTKHLFQRPHPSAEEK